MRSKWRTRFLAAAAALSDQDRLARLSSLAGRARETLAELLAHLATLDQRPGVYRASPHFDRARGRGHFALSGATGDVRNPSRDRP